MRLERLGDWVAAGGRTSSGAPGAVMSGVVGLWSDSGLWLSLSAITGSGVIAWTGICDTGRAVGDWGEIVWEIFCVGGKSSSIDLGDGVACAGRNF